MKRSAEAAWERAMKVQEVILRAIAKQITWWQAAEIIGISDRQLRRWQRRYEEHGYTGLIDRRRGRVSERQVPLTTVEEVLRLYKEQYFDFNVRHFHAKLVAEESTRTVMTALREVLETKGLFCALYSDRASHFFLTPKAGEAVDRDRLTQVGRAMKDLGVKLIPAYSPQARGRSERGFGTWQGRLPQELRVRGITTLAEANRFLHDEYYREFNQRFSVA